MNILSVVTDNNYDAIFNTWDDTARVYPSDAPDINVAYLKHIIAGTNDDLAMESIHATEKGLVKFSNNTIGAIYLGYNTNDPSSYYFDGDEYVIDAKFYSPNGFSNNDQFSIGCYFSNKNNEFYPNGLTWIIRCIVVDRLNGIYSAQVFTVAPGNVQTAVSEVFQISGIPGVLGDYYLYFQFRRYLNSVYLWASDGFVTPPVKIDDNNRPFIFTVRSLINASNEKIMPYFSHDNDNNVSMDVRTRLYFLRSSIVKYIPDVIQPVYLSLSNGHYSVNKLDFVTQLNHYPLYHQYSVDLTAKNTNGVNIIPNSVRISNVETVEGYVHAYLNNNHYIIKPQSELSLQLSGESSMMILGEDNCTVTLYDSGNFNLYGR